MSLSSVLSAAPERMEELRRAMNGYAEEYLKQEGNSVDGLEADFKKDFKFDAQKMEVQVVMQMALVKVYRELVKKAHQVKDHASVKKYESLAGGLLDLLSKSELSKLSNFALLAIGDHIRMSAETEAEYVSSFAFYKKVLENCRNGKDTTYKNEAIFGLAHIVDWVEDKDKLKKVYASLGQLEADPKSDKKTKEKALCHMVKLAHAMGDYKLAISHAKRFKELYKSSKYKVNVREVMADSYYESGDDEGALREYGNALMGYGGVRYAGKKILRIVEILTKKGELYKAYEVGSSYVKMCEKSFNRAIKDGKMVGLQLKYWQGIEAKVKALGNEPEVKKGIELAERERRKKEGAEGK